MELTKEILEKNGFVREPKNLTERHTYYHLPNRLCIIEFDTEYDEFWTQVLSRDIEITSVEHFKSILSVCGMKDLADNLIV